MFALFIAGLLALAPPASDALTYAHHPITTASSDAQRLFDEALTLTYAFDPQDAVARFREAAKADPTCAMAQWGIALAYGPNINQSYDLVGARNARTALDRALALAPKSSPEERAYIGALAQRYRAKKKGQIDDAQLRYANAMRDLSARFPDDDDAAALYAESLMDRQPWNIWSTDGKPNGDALKIETILEAVLARDPQHIMANHLYIHVMEQSPDFEKARDAADRLGAMHFEPAAEHLVHMPSHIYLHDGQYTKAIAANDDALAHFAQWRIGPHDPTHGGYRFHDAAMKFSAELMSGRSQGALATARSDDLSAGDVAVLETQLRFHQWQAILAAAEKPATQIEAFARAIALAATGKTTAAIAARKAFAPFAPGDKGEIEASLIDAAIARAAGNATQALVHVRAAVRRQDALGYDEPPNFFYPIRETLGALELAAGQAEAAKRTFEADLAVNAGNPRSLFGLAAALDALHQTDAAQKTRAAFERAWSDADVPLHLADL